MLDDFRLLPTELCPTFFASEENTDVKVTAWGTTDALSHALFAAVNARIMSRWSGCKPPVLEYPINIGIEYSAEQRCVITGLRLLGIHGYSITPFARLVGQVKTWNESALHTSMWARVRLPRIHSGRHRWVGVCSVVIVSPPSRSRSRSPSRLRI